MKAAGIVRRLDELRRIVIPIEICRVQGIDSGTPLEVFVEEDMIILRKYDKAIGATEKAEALISFIKGMYEFKDCAEVLRKIEEVKAMLAEQEKEKVRK